MGLHTVFPLPATAAKKYDKEDCQHHIYVQKSMVNTNQIYSCIMKGVFLEKGGRGKYF